MGRLRIPSIDVDEPFPMSDSVQHRFLEGLGVEQAEDLQAMIPRTPRQMRTVRLCAFTAGVNTRSVAGAFI